MIKVAHCLLVLALAGCASVSSHVPAGSMAEGVDAADMDTLAANAVDLVRKHATDSNSTIGLQSAGDDQFTPRLVDGLNKAGYNVVDGDRLRYQVGPLGDNLLLRISIDGTDSSQLYAKDKDGKLVPVGPLSVWSVDR